MGAGSPWQPHALRALWRSSSPQDFWRLLGPPTIHALPHSSFTFGLCSRNAASVRVEVTVSPGTQGPFAPSMLLGPLGNWRRKFIQTQAECLRGNQLSHVTQLFFS